MSGNTWVIADPHFGHAGVTRFTRADGVTPLRPWDDVDEMDAEMIRRWNEVVEPSDRVYVLGDVAMTRRALAAVLPQLKGRKVLVKGNHDIDKMSFYAQHFDDIRAYVVKKGFIMSHIPIHPGSLARWKLNIHGHLHSNVVMRPMDRFRDERKFGVLNKSTDKYEVPDERYVCVSVEHIDYRPKLLSTILQENQHVGEESP